MSAVFCPALARLLILYGALYAGFGVLSPYLPSLLNSRGLRPEEIALVLAAGGTVRLAAGPVTGRLADRFTAPKLALSFCSAAAALSVLLFPLACGLWLLLAIGALHSAALAPLAPLSDTLALGKTAARWSGHLMRRRFHYGWVRGAGSAAFILGSILSGQVAGRFAISTVVWLNAALLGSAALAALRVPQQTQTPCVVPVAEDALSGLAALLKLPLYRQVVLIAALVLGSHAMHDSFAVIMWGAAGIGPGTAALLWSSSVAAEVVVFLFIGHPLLARLGPARAVMFAAGAGMIRWTVMAATTWPPALIVVEPLHGITFALLHLTSMRLLTECVPQYLAATALTFYGAIGAGAPAILLTLLSGPLYAHFGAQGFGVMAALCAAALPLARTLREPFSESF
jgi:MFS transporter, PPP family, 3-phenylpropionic acid transporter